MPYGIRLLESLLGSGVEVHLSITRAAAAVLRHDHGLAVDLDRFDPASLGLKTAEMPGRLRYFSCDALAAPIASGSFLTHGMVVCPCSCSTLGTIAAGSGDSLIDRAAEVHLKERRKLILVTRETPLSLVQIENMARLARAGAVILPATPAFYQGAQSIQDLVDFVVARIGDQLGLDFGLSRRWGTQP